MAFSMSLWSINDDKTLKALSKSKLNFENDLESWIMNDPSILDLDILILGRQVHTGYGGYIDVLGINRDGDLVIIELKRNKTPRDIVAQCLDYASWINGLTIDNIANICNVYVNQDLASYFPDFFEDQIPESLNENHQIVIVASSLDDATERIIQYLSDKHSVNINAIFFNVFEVDGKQILGRSWLKDPEFVEEKSKAKRPPWTGYLFVNTGIAEGRPRSWDLNTQFSFVSAGGGPRWINAIKKLKPGDKIFAYIKGSGYVGYGIVEEEAVPVSDYKYDGDAIIDILPEDHPWRTAQAGLDHCEWLARVKWIKTFPRNQAKWLTNGFANQNVVCKLRDRRTFEYLISEFGIDLGNSVD